MTYNGLAGRPVKPAPAPLHLLAEDEGLEPPSAHARRFSRPLPYQLGLVLRNLEYTNFYYLSQYFFSTTFIYLLDFSCQPACLLIYCVMRTGLITAKTTDAFFVVNYWKSIVGSHSTCRANSYTGAASLTFFFIRFGSYPD